ncbi:MAG: Rieske 2Fe-2S domain-containing protein, partial [Microcoleaceae cyanobacterium]
ALRNMRRGQIALLVYAVISIATVAVLSEYWRGAVGLPLILTSLASLGLCSWLQWKIIPQFYFVDYIHADR